MDTGIIQKPFSLTAPPVIIGRIGIDAGFIDYTTSSLE
jgi:hypothetical protein